MMHDGNPFLPNYGTIVQPPRGKDNIYDKEHAKLCNEWHGYQGNDQTVCPGWPHECTP